MTRMPFAAVLLLLPASAAMSAREKSTPFIVPESLRTSGSVEGHAASFAVLPDALSVPILGPDLVRRAGFSGGLFGAQGRIGSVRISGKTGVHGFSLAGLAFKRRAVWFDRALGADPASSADVVLGPGSFPADPIRWRLPRAPTARSRAYELPLLSLNGDGFATVITVAGQRLPVQFSLTRDDNLATAQAAALLSSAFGGRFKGDPVIAPVRLGVSRPVRRLTLDREVDVGPIAIDNLLVRTTDYGSTASIPGEEDPNEIVVVGSKQGGTKSISRLVLGEERWRAARSC